MENITQGVARDLLLNSMNTLNGYDIVGHVHDEVIVECSRETTTSKAYPSCIFLYAKRSRFVSFANLFTKALHFPQVLDKIMMFR